MLVVLLLMLVLIIVMGVGAAAFIAVSTCLSVFEAIVGESIDKCETIEIIGLW